MLSQLICCWMGIVLMFLILGGTGAAIELCANGHIIDRGAGVNTQATVHIVRNVLLLMLAVFGTYRLVWCICDMGSFYKLLTAAVIVSYVGMIGAGFLWYTEIDYTAQEIRVRHFSSETVYDFSDVTEYRWEETDPEDDTADEKMLVLTLPDGTTWNTQRYAYQSTSDGAFEMANVQWPMEAPQP